MTETGGSDFPCSSSYHGNGPDISNDEVLLTCVPDDALGDEQVDEDLPRRTGDKEPGFQNIFGLASCLKHIRLVSD